MTPIRPTSGGSLLLLAAFLAACAPSTRKEAARQGTDTLATPAADSLDVPPDSFPSGDLNPDGEDIPPAPLDFALAIGQGGGFTGIWEGYTVKADGTVEAWQGRKAGENPRAAGTLSPEERARLWNLLEDAGFPGLEMNTPGNMTYFMKVTADMKTHEARWTDAAPPADSTTQGTLKEVYRLCRELLSEAAAPDR